VGESLENLIGGLQIDAGLMGSENKKMVSIIEFKVFFLLDKKLIVLTFFGFYFIKGAIFKNRKCN
jgi:hypothetical protein